VRTGSAAAVSKRVHAGQAWAGNMADDASQSAGNVGASVHGPNSDVLPSGAVAVAVRMAPTGSAWAKVTVKLASPLASVVTMSFAPTKRRPSPKPDGSQESLAKTSMRNVVLGVELSVPSMLVPSPKT